jgi:hypothetical protein
MAKLTIGFQMSPDPACEERKQVTWASSLGWSVTAAHQGSFGSLGSLESKPQGMWETMKGMLESRKVRLVRLRGCWVMPGCSWGSPESSWGRWGS